MTKKQRIQYEVTAETPSTVRRDLIRVWANLDVEGDREVKYVWSYEQSPDIPECVYILRAEGEVVGSAGYGVRTFRLAGLDARVAVMGDLAVMPEHRVLVPALALAKAGREHATRDFAFAYGMPNARAEAVLTRAKYAKLGRVVRYAKIARHAPYLEMAAKNLGKLRASRVPAWLTRAALSPPLRTFGGWLLDRLDSLKHLRRYVATRRKYALHWTNLNDPMLDAIWLASRDEYCVVGSRTSSFLAWRFAHTNDVRVAILVERESRQPVAYAVISNNDYAATLLDAFGQVAAFVPLVTLLLRDVTSDKSIRVMSCNYLGRIEFVEALRRCGFRARSDVSRCVCTLPGTVPPSHLPLLNDPQNWHLTAFDEDV